MSHATSYRIVELPPCEALRPYVDCYRVVQIAGMPGPPQAIRVFPTGRTDLFFSLGNPVAPPDHATASSRRSFQSYVAGPIHQAFLTRIHGQLDIIGVTLKLGAGRFLLHHDLHTLTGQNIAFGDVLGTAGARLTEQLLAMPTTKQRIATLEHFLVQRVSHWPTLDPDIQAALHLLTQTHGQLPIRHVAQVLHISDRQLERKFSMHVGLSPKRFARVARLRHMLALIHKLPGDWATIVASGGYYDQAHFIHEFTSSVGLAPTEYLRSALRDGGFLQYNTPPV